MPGKPKHLGVPNGRMVLAVSDGGVPEEGIQRRERNFLESLRTFPADPSQRHQAASSGGPQHLPRVPIQPGAEPSEHRPTGLA
uniref:Regulator of G-protein signaling 14 n=1 Tax=Mus musculus TaxID=10090 RepID=D6RCH4_MOUSE